MRSEDSRCCLCCAALARASCHDYIHSICRLRKTAFTTQARPHVPQWVDEKHTASIWLDCVEQQWRNYLWQWHTTVNCNVILYVGFLGTISTQLERWCNLLAASFCYTEYMLLDVCVYHQTTYYFCCCWWMSLLLSLRSSFRITSKNWTRRLIVHNATEDHRIFL